MGIDKHEVEVSALKLEVSYDAQEKYIDHLAFLYGYHIDKLPVKVVVEVVALPGECVMMAYPAFRHIPKIVSHVDSAVVTKGGELGYQGLLGTIDDITNLVV